MHAYSPGLRSSGSSQDRSSTTLSQVDRLRQWRDDALMQHQYQTAEMVGDKIYLLTKDSTDLFWLAQVLFSSGNYTRAKELLFSKGQVEKSVSCRYLAALCHTKVGKWEEALEVVGANNTFKPGVKKSSSSKGSDVSISGIKLEASMCFLRGQIYTNLNNFDRAKQCYIEAVNVDANCYEAFDQLVRNSLLSPTEEWDLLNSLDFVESCGENAEFVKSLYTIRLSKYVNLAEYSDAETTLKEGYGLGESGDVLTARADLLFVQCRFNECLKICEKILETDPYRLVIMPIYLSCLYELGGKNRLFIVAHRLADDHPEEPTTWLAVGIYYLTINKVAEARRYFGKASIMYPYFSQAWVGFAHTFAIEGEHEQAISAYSTAARLFPGTHLPLLFLGMQHLHLGNLILAEEYVNSSYALCSTDPLLLNELGVVHYHKNDLQLAEKFLLQADSAAAKLKSDPKAWISIQTNLGHVYRKSEQFSRAYQLFAKVLQVSPQDSNIHSALGLVNLQSGRIDEAISNFHNALSITQNDPVASDLLKRALEESAESGNFSMSIPDDEILLNEPEFQDIIAGFDSTSTPPSNKILPVEEYTEEDSVMDIE